MSATILTYEDLVTFKKELFQELQAILPDAKSATPTKWLKSRQVREMLSISNGTLMSLRINGTISYTRIGGAILYDYDEIMAVLLSNKIDNKLG